MKKTNIIILQIIFFIFFALFTLMFIPNASSNLWQNLKDCSVYNNGWVANSKGSSVYYETLPTFASIKDDGQDIWISKELSDVSNGDCFGFFSFQQQVYILLDGKEVYSFVPSTYANSQTPGNKWNFLPLNEEDNGKVLTVHIYQCYSKGRITIPTMYYGSQSGIVLNYLQMLSSQLYLSLAIVFIGIILLMFHYLKRGQSFMGDSLKWLALFSIFRGIWGYIEGNTYSFFISRLLLISQLSYMSLKIAVILYIQFINEYFFEKRNKILNILSICSISEFFITFLLQILGIVDFANTVFITHIIMTFGGLYTITTLVKKILEKRKNTKVITTKRRFTYLFQLMSTAFIIITAIVDMLRYYLTNSPNVAKYSRFGDIFFVIVMAIGLFLDYMYLLRMGQQAASIKEEALTDPMTKLYNRTAFERDIKQKNKRNCKNHGIIVLDLNNLKLFNDELGHDSGDEYIIESSKIIYDIFSPYGFVYRIGGDEFCVITRNLSEEQFEVLRADMETTIAHKNAFFRNSATGISSGYAHFDSKLDKNLNHTMKRADKKMYLRKAELKNSSS